MDATALNYNPNATDDNGSCTYITGGCTDQTACNFDYTAQEDDGTCEFNTCAGCIVSWACNYNADATLFDGSCIFPDANGTCPSNCDSDADGDGICDANEIAGCIYSNAINFEPLPPTTMAAATLWDVCCLSTAATTASPTPTAAIAPTRHAAPTSMAMGKSSWKTFLNSSWPTVHQDQTGESTGCRRDVKSLPMGIAEMDVRRCGLHIPNGIELRPIGDVRHRILCVVGLHRRHGVQLQQPRDARRQQLPIQPLSRLQRRRSSPSHRLA